MSDKIKVYGFLSTIEEGHTQLKVNGLKFDLDSNRGIATLLKVPKGLVQIPHAFAFANYERHAGDHFGFQIMQGKDGAYTNGSGRDSYSNFLSELVPNPAYYKPEPQKVDTFKVFIPNDVAKKIVIAGRDRVGFAYISDKVEFEYDIYRSVTTALLNMEYISGTGITIKDIAESWGMNLGMCSNIQKSCMFNIILKLMYKRSGLQSVLDFGTQRGLSIYKIHHMLRRAGVFVKRSEIYPAPATDIKPEWIRATQAVQVYKRIVRENAYPYTDKRTHDESFIQAYDAKFCSMVENVTGKHVKDISEGTNTFIDWLGYNPDDGSVEIGISCIYTALIQYTEGKLTKDEFEHEKAGYLTFLPNSIDKDAVVADLSDYLEKNGPNAWRESLQRHIIRNIIWRKAIK